LPTFINKFRDEIDFTDSTAATLADHPRPFVDLKTTTIDGAIRKIVEEFYKKDITSGITEFPAQILRVEQRVGKFEKSYLDNLGREINRELNRRYKVKVVIVDDLKEAPKTFDETPEDRQVIDNYPDFVYIPYSFGNSEPMNVGDFVMVTYGNLLSHQDGRIIYKISGGSHVQGSVGKPRKQASVKPSSSAKEAFKQKPKREEKPILETPEPQPVTTTPETPSESETPSTEPKKRTLKDTGWLTEEKKQELNNAEKKPPDGEIKDFEDFREKFYNAFPRSKIHMDDLNNDLTKRDKPNKTAIYIDFSLPENKKYKRTTAPARKEDDIYFRAFIDAIALHESITFNFGYDSIYLNGGSHPEDAKIKKFKDFSQHPRRHSFTKSAKDFINTASSAAGRYQFVYNVWKEKYESRFPDFRPESQDEACFLKLLSRLKNELNITEDQFLGFLKENTIESFEKIFKGVQKTIVVGTGKSARNTVSTRYLGMEWTSLPNGIEEAKPVYEGQVYKYTPALFRAFYNLILDDQKRILNGEDTKYNTKTDVHNEAIPKVLEEARALVAAEEDINKKLEISRKILGQANVPVLQPAGGEEGKGAIVAQANQPNGRTNPKKIGKG
jgi:muramidase (phage lysozyme)